ncbi:hypothetical protein CANCADRAFT_15624, partial [Tortispora caseinolytica NRRL Y-17796]
STFSIGEAIYIAIKPVIKLIVTSAIGALLARKNILDAESSRKLSIVIINVMLPGLIFSKIIPSLSPDQPVVLGVLILTAVIYLAVGYVFALIVWVTTSNPYNWKHGLLCSGIFNNVGDLPMAYVLTIGKGPPFTEDDTDLGLAYATILACVTMLGVINLGGAKLIAKDFRDYDPSQDHTPEVDVENAPTDSHDINKDTLEPNSYPLTRIPSAPLAPMYSLTEINTDTISRTFSHTSAAARSLRSGRSRALSHDSSVRSYRGHESVISSDSEDTHKTHRNIIVRMWNDSILPFLKGLMNPPSITLIVSIIIAFVPPLKALFVSTNYHIAQAPDGMPVLNVFIDIGDFLGRATVTCGMLLLGAMIGRLRFAKLPHGFWRSVALMTILKLVVLPIIGIAWVEYMQSDLGWIPKDDQMLAFVLIITAGVPSATTQVYFTTYFAPPGIHPIALDCLAIYLLVQYISLIVTLPIVVSYTLMNII